MKRYWDRYGWIVCILLLLLFFIPLVWSRSGVCNEGDKDCLRNWISATGSWAALFAAIPTIFYFSRQVDAAIKGNQNSAKIQLRRNYALAQKVKNISFFLEMTAIRFSNDIKKQTPGFVASPPSRSQVMSKIDTIADMLDQGGFGKFEEEIEFPTPYYAEFIRRRISSIKQSLVPLSEIALTEANRTDILHFCDSCKRYARFCREAANRFINEADEMRGVSQTVADVDDDPE